MYSLSPHENAFSIIFDTQIPMYSVSHLTHVRYRVAKTHMMSDLYRSVSAKETYNE